jgi:hypothetical protein
VRYALWNVIGVAPRLLSPAWRSRATEEQERIGWEMAVRIERIIAPVHDEATSSGSRRSWRPSATPRPDGVYTRSVYPSRTSAPLARSPESPRLCPPGHHRMDLYARIQSEEKGSATAAIKLWL